MEDESLELLDDSEGMEDLYVLGCLVEVTVKGRDTCVATIHLLEVAVADHAVDEASGGLGPHQEVEIEVVDFTG
mgnify:CR=1 FL=1